MDVKDLKRLLESVKESDISELVLETGEYKLSVKRGGEVLTAAVQHGPQGHAGQSAVPTPPAPAASAPPTASALPTEAAPTVPPAVSPTVAPTEAAPPAPTQSAPESNLVEVTAPIVGTFYAAPSPDAPNFVKVGDRVEAGAVLCIIEAMKLMNEIEAEVAGTVREILVANEEPVEYGQALFRLEPA